MACVALTDRASIQVAGDADQSRIRSHFGKSHWAPPLAAEYSSQRPVRAPGSTFWQNGETPPEATLYARWHGHHFPEPDE